MRPHPANVAAGAGAGLLCINLRMFRAPWPPACVPHRGFGFSDACVNERLLFRNLVRR
jgi:hypothetical protein